MLRKLARRSLLQIRKSLGIIEMKTDLNIIKSVAIENYISKELRENRRFQDKKRLNKYECQFFSQFGEDGIINELFARIGTTNKFFAEIGAGEGMENNTTNLLINNWKGVWVEYDLQLVKLINKYFFSFIKSKKLIVKNTFVTSKNIENLFKTVKIPRELDLL